MAVRITWGRVNELQCQIAQRFSVSYSLRREPDHWTLSLNGSILPEKFLGPREVFTYLTGVEAGLEQTVPAVSEEVRCQLEETEQLEFEDAMLDPEELLEFFNEHAGAVPLPVAIVALAAIESICEVVNQDLQARNKGNYSHNLISVSLMAMSQTLKDKHSFSEEDAYHLTDLVLKAAPIVTALYGIRPEKEEL